VHVKKSEPVPPALLTHAVAKPARRPATAKERMAADSPRMAGPRKLGEAVNRSPRARLDNAHQALVMLNAELAQQDDGEKG
jgi:hypothetical protein